MLSLYHLKISKYEFSLVPNFCIFFSFFFFNLSFQRRIFRCFPRRQIYFSTCFTSLFSLFTLYFREMEFERNFINFFPISNGTYEGRRKKKYIKTVIFCATMTTQNMWRNLSNKCKYRKLKSKLNLYYYYSTLHISHEFIWYILFSSFSFPLYYFFTLTDRLTIRFVSYSMLV